MRSERLLVIGLMVFGLHVIGFFRSPLLFGGEQCASIPGSCSAPPLSCQNRQSNGGTDNCSRVCNNGTFPNPCQPTPAASCARLTAQSTYLCGGTCPYNFPKGSCAVLLSGDRPATCAREGIGHWSNCPSLPTCPISRLSCSSLSPFVPYGFAFPGDPTYGFPQVKDQGKPVFPDPFSQDLVGLAAKGNIIIGDYTKPAFRNNVLPNLKPGATSKTQPYVVDQTDANSLGYQNAAAAACGGKSPCFDGNYDQQDKEGMADGLKADRTPRKFYESSLSDASFQNMVANLPNEARMPTGANTTVIDAVLYTNHALAGFIPTTGTTVFNGAIVSRDDGIVSNGPFQITHDIRLLSDQAAQRITLPLDIKRSTLSGFKECAASGCH